MSALPQEAQLELETRDLSKSYPVRSSGLALRASGHVHAVDSVDLSIRTGATLGLVGESGCGKSTLGRMIVRLLDPTSGDVLIRGRELAGLPRGEWRRLRPEVQMVFQDTQASLDPRMTIAATIAEPLRLNERLRGAALRRRVAELVERVGVDLHHLSSYPHELSGGQRQRIVIARALATRPKLLVLDEPTSALDVSIQAQIINLLKDIQDELGLTYLFISHNLAVVRGMSDMVAVMYLGRVVERGPAERVFTHPLHPYTRLLLASVPRPDPRVRRQRIEGTGDLPRPEDPPPGCPFHPRCSRAEAVCSTDRPALVEHEAGHEAACHFAAEFCGVPFVPVVTQKR
ncbi:ABC transporter ATP-binding protein [Mycolicibacterium hassiacum]|uniref:ABC transporter ATP-binding protein n=1 Tax=Mycolicibacterium hassiacum TaxID=46351 RepID=UPI0023F80612|nr:oligopeptide/dipeptide ABC transporter ATP-binding protein [Mycolicibacterium hassiacum]